MLYCITRLLMKPFQHKSLLYLFAPSTRHNERNRAKKSDAERRDAYSHWLDEINRFLYFDSSKEQPTSGDLVKSRGLVVEPFHLSAERSSLQSTFSKPSNAATQSSFNKLVVESASHNSATSGKVRMAFARISRASINSNLPLPPLWVYVHIEKIGLLVEIEARGTKDWIDWTF